MKYMLIMSGTKKEWDWFSSWQKEDLRRQVAFMREFGKSLKESGEYVAAEGLAWSGQSGRPADHRRHLPGGEGIPGRLLDCRRREPRARLRNRGAGVGGPGAGRRAVQYAD
jgi:hypothetical protein